MLSVLHLPKTTHEIYILNGELTLLYCVVTLLLEGIYKTSWIWTPRTNKMRKQDYIFNSGTFATSCILALGVFDEQVLKLIGDISAYLILASLVGLWYAIDAALPKK